MTSGKDRRNWPVRIVDLHDPDLAAADRRWWMSRPPEERMAALDRIRFEHDGPQPRLAPEARVVSLKHQRPARPQNQPANPDSIEATRPDQGSADA
ncbi:MAG: hypothetical protein ACYSUU_10375 [Planctomycetota bacterium]|jgi:hypothetical protein